MRDSFQFSLLMDPHKHRQPTWTMLYKYRSLLCLSLLPSSSLAANCYSPSIRAPSIYDPLVSDCVKLAAAIRALPYARTYLDFAAHKPPEEVAWVQVPQAWYWETCYVNVWPDGQPNYDIARFTDFANIIDGVVQDCLGVQGGEGSGHGGYDHSGGNHFLVVEVSGYIDVPMKKKLGGVEGGSSIAGSGNETEVEQISVERDIQSTESDDSRMGRSWMA